MKIIFTVLLFLGFQSAFAEYNGWFITFELETTAGERIIGNVYRASAYFKRDSLANQNYVTKRLIQTDLNHKDSGFTYFQHLITYIYTPYEDSDTARIYTLAGKQTIEESEILRITVLNLVDFGYLMGISNHLNIEDTIWMQKPPLKTYSADGYLCSWQIFVHEQSKNTEQILAELTESMNEYKSKIAELQEILQGEENEAYREAEVKMVKLEESRDEKTFEFLDKLDGEKVVIISFCSC